MSQDKQKTHLFSIWRWIAFGFGAGWLPKAPGTWGSILAVPIVYFMSNELWTIALWTFTAWVSIHFYEKVAHTHDEPMVVIDEIAGMFWTFYLLPLTLPILLSGLILFRVFDILKPFPISWADRNVPGSFGTLLDDLMAGAMSCVVLHLIVYWGWL